MHSPSPSQPRIFLVGYRRAYRLELSEGFRDQGFAVSVFEDARLAAHAMSHTHPEACRLFHSGDPQSSNILKALA